jgi:hypothetical protein
VDLFTPSVKTLQAIQQAVTPGRQTTLQNRADLADTLWARPLTLLLPCYDTVTSCGHRTPRRLARSTSAASWARCRRRPSR